MSEDIEIINCEEMPDGLWKVNLKHNYKGRPYFYHKGKLEFTGPATIIEEGKYWEGWDDLPDDMKRLTEPWIYASRVIQRKEKFVKSKLYKDVKIVVHNKDDIGEDHDNKYCAIVMGWTGRDWVNTGIVVREYLPLMAFSKAMEIAIKEDLWK